MWICKALSFPCLLQRLLRGANPRLQLSAGSTGGGQAAGAGGWRRESRRADPALRSSEPQERRWQPGRGAQGAWAPGSTDSLVLQLRVGPPLCPPSPGESGSPGRIVPEQRDGAPSPSPSSEGPSPPPRPPGSCMRTSPCLRLPQQRRDEQIPPAPLSPPAHPHLCISPGDTVTSLGPFLPAGPGLSPHVRPQPGSRVQGLGAEAEPWAAAFGTRGSSVPVPSAMGRGGTWTGRAARAPFPQRSPFACLHRSPAEERRDPDDAGGSPCSPGEMSPMPPGSHHAGF